jgi:hypothetical protein
MEAPPCPPVEAAWHRDPSGRVRNDALGLWFVLRSFRDGSQGVILRADEKHDGPGVALFNLGGAGSELPAGERDESAGIGHEIVLEINAADSYPELPPGLDLRALLTGAVLAHYGNPALYRMGEDKDEYARVRVEFLDADEWSASNPPA